MDILKEGTISPQRMDVDEETTESQQASMASTLAWAPAEGSAAAAAVETSDEGVAAATHVDASVEVPLVELRDRPPLGQRVLQMLPQRFDSWRTSRHLATTTRPTRSTQQLALLAGSSSRSRTTRSHRGPHTTEQRDPLFHQHGCQ